MLGQTRFGLSLSQPGTYTQLPDLLREVESLSRWKCRCLGLRGLDFGSLASGLVELGASGFSVCARIVSSCAGVPDLRFGVRGPHSVSSMLGAGAHSHENNSAAFI